MKNCNGKSDDEIMENAEMFHTAVYNLSSCVTGYAPIATERFPLANTDLEYRVSLIFIFYLILENGPTDVFGNMQICNCTSKLLYIHQSTASFKDHLYTKV